MERTNEELKKMIIKEAKEIDRNLSSIYDELEDKDPDMANMVDMVILSAALIQGLTKEIK